MIALAAGALAAAAVWAALPPLPRAGPAPTARTTARPATPWSTHRRWVALGGATVMVGLLSPPLALVVPVAVSLRAHLMRVRAQRVHARLVTAGLPDAVDLLLLGSGAGLSLPLTHRLVAPHLRSPVGVALAEAEASAAGGRGRAEAIVDALTPLGDRALALAHLLADHLRYGVPLVPGLERLGLELRLDRRRAAEQQARRVPVRLLGPLVMCTLPAFALLTIVPLLVASLRALPS